MNTAEDIVRDKNRGIVSIAHEATVLNACQVMLENKIGAILVHQNDKLVGIWTERDLLRHIVREGFDPRLAKVGDVMSSPLHSAPHNTPVHKLEEMFLGLFVRHLLVEKNGEYIGLISIGDVLRAGLLEKDRQFKAINALVSWDYYENWKWGRKKQKGKSDR
jgi:signal-transduction protein with cAMP-binding, CBS, and nucleotidyltransferase domain